MMANGARLRSEGGDIVNDLPVPAGQWPQVARNWRNIGAPLRPGAEDVTFFAQVIADWSDDHPDRAPRGLILGVTPELHDLPWADRAQLHAADRTVEMIEHVWPGRRDLALHCDWRAIPLPRGSVDIGMCDGGLHLLAAPDAQQALAQELADLVTPGGRVAFRLFLPPTVPETADDVLEDLLAGRIRDLNCLKLRLGPALTPSPEEGVALRDVWACLHDLAGAGEWRGLAARLGWAEDHLAAIDSYRDSLARYHFVDQDRALALFTSGTDHAFELVRIVRADYAMGQSCPTVVFQRS